MSKAGLEAPNTLAYYGLKTTQLTKVQLLASSGLYNLPAASLVE
jgi:hypothetical protein